MTTHDFGDGNGEVAAHQQIVPASEDGNGILVSGWVADTASVSSEVFVSGVVYGTATVTGECEIIGAVYGDATVTGEGGFPIVEGSVYEEATLAGYVVLQSGASIYGSANVNIGLSGESTVQIGTGSQIYGAVTVKGNVTIAGAVIYGNAYLDGGQDLNDGALSLDGLGITIYDNAILEGPMEVTPPCTIYENARIVGVAPAQIGA